MPHHQDHGAWYAARFNICTKHLAETGEPIGGHAAGTCLILVERDVTPRWRESDSNHRSRSRERLFWALPIGDGGTKGEATYRFRLETAMLAWSGSP